MNEQIEILEKMIDARKKVIDFYVQQRDTSGSPEEVEKAKRCLRLALTQLVDLNTELTVFKGILPEDDLTNYPKVFRVNVTAKNVEKYKEILDKEQYDYLKGKEGRGLYIERFIIDGEYFMI